MAFTLGAVAVRLAAFPLANQQGPSDHSALTEQLRQLRSGSALGGGHVTTLHVAAFVCHIYMMTDERRPVKPKLNTNLLRNTGRIATLGQIMTLRTR